MITTGTILAALLAGYGFAFGVQHKLGRVLRAAGLPTREDALADNAEPRRYTALQRWAGAGLGCAYCVGFWSGVVVFLLLWAAGAVGGAGAWAWCPILALAVAAFSYLADEVGKLAERS